MSNGIKAKQNPDKFFTVEFFGVTIIISCLLLLVCLLFGNSVLFEIGGEVQSFILGVFGYLSYPILVTLIFIGFIMLLGKKATEKRSKKPIFYTVTVILLITCLLTVLTSLQTPTDFESYLAYAFEGAKGGLATSVAGGAMLSLITYFPVFYLTYLGAIVLFAILTLLTLVFAYKSSKHTAIIDKEIKIAEINAKAQADAQVKIHTQNAQFENGNSYAQNNGYQYQQPQNRYAQPYYQQPNQNQYGYAPQPSVSQAPYGYERSELYKNQNVTYQEPTFGDREKHDKSMEILYGNTSTYSDAFNQSFSGSGMRVDISNQQTPKQNLDAILSNPIKKEEVVKDYTLDDSFSFNYTKPESTDFEVTVNEIESEEITIESNEESKATEIIKNVVAPSKPIVSEPPIEKEVPTVTIEEGDEYAKKLIENMPLNYKYKKPPVSIFKTVDNTQNNYEFELFKAETKAKILTTLKTFGVDTDIPRVFKGPAVTRFDIAIPPDVPMSKVTKLQNDLNLRIAAKSAIRMIAPIPNTSYVGIEVPNKEPDSVSIKDIIVSDDFINTKPFSLVFALGKDVIGRPVSLDIADMPHLLVTGTTGSGKSVCLNTLIVSLISKYGPDELRFVIVDPKRVDLEPFKDIPHMMFGEIIEDVPMTNSMLTWAVEEMESRYRQLASSRAKNIKDYNVKAKASGQKIMPRIVILMDEFADIMMQDKKGVATKVCLIAQKARAAGIHLVLAAQRPSVDVIEGPIKSNLPSRIVFRAASMPDSVVSLGEPGAEKLLGRGDCLYKTNGMLSIERVMGAYVSDDEMYDVIDYVSDNNEKYYDYNNWAKIVARVNQSTQSVDYSSSGDGEEPQSEGGIDPIYIKAMRVGYSFGGLSASFLQRKLAVGFPRAGKIIDWLTDNGYITPNAISGKRQMVMTKESFEEKFGAE